MNLAAHLHSLEQQLLDPAVRRNASDLRNLLAPAFFEIGSSGRTYTRDQIIAELASETTSFRRPALGDFALHASSECWAIVTYRTTRNAVAGEPARSSLRSSTWVHLDGGWQLLLHQGTPRSPRPGCPPLAFSSMV